MGTGRFNFPRISIMTIAMVLACTPFAAAQEEDPFCNTYTICFAIIILATIPLLMAYIKKKKDEELAAQHRPVGGQPTMAEPVPKGYEQTPSFGTTPYHPEPQGYPHMLQPPEPRKAASPGACPRCGSTNIQNFGTGEHKCLECKKIYMD
jgi:hypothetical protein